MSVSDRVRSAIELAENKGVTRHQIAKESGVDPAGLLRFLEQDADVRVSTIDKLVEYLGLELKKIT